MPPANTVINKLNYRLAAKILFILPCVLIVFHTANLLGLVPVNIVWTGRITSNKTMMFMGMLSIFLNVLIAFCGAVRAGYINNQASTSFTDKAIPFVFWWLVGNTVANVFSKSMFEVIAFTPVLIVLTVCCYRVMAAEHD